MRATTQIFLRLTLRLQEGTWNFTQGLCTKESSKFFQSHILFTYTRGGLKNVGMFLLFTKTPPILNPVHYCRFASALPSLRRWRLIRENLQDPRLLLENRECTPSPPWWRHIQGNILRTWKNSESWSMYRLWDLKNSEQWPLYIELKIARKLLQNRILNTQNQ